MEIRPITFRQACDFVAEHHRHHRPTVGCKFCVGLYDTDKLVGVAICGRPVGRKLDDGFTCEVNRLCTDGTYQCLLYALWGRVVEWQKKWVTRKSSHIFLNPKTVQALKQAILLVRGKPEVLSGTVLVTQGSLILTK